MKRRKLPTHSVYFVLLIAICAVAVFSFYSPEICFADKSQSGEEIIEDNVDENLSKMDLSKLEELLASLENDFRTLFGNDAVSTIKSIIDGDFQGNFSTYADT